MLKITKFLFVMVIACLMGLPSAQGQILEVLSEPERVNSLTFSPDGKTFAAGCGKFVGLLQQPRPGKVVIRDTVTRKARAIFDGHGDGVSCVAFASNNQMFATGGYDGAVRLWSSQTAETLGSLEVKVGPIVSLAFSPDGSRLAAGGWSGGQEDVWSEFVVWEMPARKLIATVKTLGDVLALAYLHDNATIISGSGGGTVNVWDGKTFKKLRTLSQQLGGIRCLAVSPDGKRLAIASGDYFASPDHKHNAGALQVWTTADWKQVFCKTMPEIVYTVAFTPDSNASAISGTNPAIRFLDASGREIGVLSGHTGEVRAICFSPDGKCLVSGGGDETIRVWSLAETLGRTAK